MMRSSRALLTVLLVAALAASVAARAHEPFAPVWQKAVVVWDYHHNALQCHEATALLVGEERRSITCGTDERGKEIRAEFRLLTFRCEPGKHQIRIWMDPKMDLIREVSCHGKIAESGGYDKEAHGHAVKCAEKHKLVLEGTAQD